MKVSTFFYCILVLISCAACRPETLPTENVKAVLVSASTDSSPTSVDMAVAAPGLDKVLEPAPTAMVEPSKPTAKPVSVPVSRIDKPTRSGNSSRTTKTFPTRADSSLTVPTADESTQDVKTLASISPRHDRWDALLRTHVRASGRVDYAALKAKMAELDAYLEELGNHIPSSEWPATVSKAYWINVYNAYTVKLILKHYPVASIRDIDGGNPWDTKWIDLGERRYSLNQIEHEILRPRYGDARIHFAVNCAAASCPPLHNRAFTAANTNATLERLTSAFINNSQYNKISRERVQVSRIFEWYQADFGDLRTYLNRYSSIPIAAEIAIEYMEYDWSLNGN